MRFALTTLFAGLILLAHAPYSTAREWKSLKGEYSVEAELIASDDEHAILKRESGKLVMVRQAELSDADRQFLKSKDVSERLSESVSTMQTWTSKDGLKIRGRVLAFGRKETTLARSRAKVTIDGTKFGDFDDLHQRLFLRVLSELESRKIENELELNTWALTTLAGKPKTYTLEGVLMQLESGDQIPVPFFLFSEEDLQVLQPGWQAWLESHEDEQARQRENLLVQTEAAEYQRQRNQADYERRQIEYLRLNMLAAATGLTSIWEVGLRPPPGVYGRPTSVMVTARDSLAASQMALSQYPGYQVFGVRRASR
ncbi:MAG: SHD1 domain-containing protein [Planctomycetota bacterium]